MGQNEESPEKIHKVLDDNVEQISSVSYLQNLTNIYNMGQLVVVYIRLLTITIYKGHSKIDMLL